MQPKLQVRIGGDASEVVRALQSTGDAATRLTSAISRIGHYSVAGLAFGAVANLAATAGSALFEASVNAQRLTTALNAATGGRAAAEIGTLSALTDRLGINFLATTKSYAGFAAAARETSLEGEGARKVFESVAKASAVMGLSADDTSGVLRALQQMLSKGTVQSEELRGQLGERLPGAFQIAARAMGVTTRELGKMLESGEVLSTDFLPRFARQLDQELGGAAEQAGKRLESATERMANAWEKLKQRIGDAGISSVIAQSAQAIANDMNAISDAMKIAEINGSGFFGQIGAGLGMLVGRSAGLSLLNDDFKTFDKRLASVRQRVIDLQGEVEKGGFYGKSVASENLAAAKNELAWLERISSQVTGIGGEDHNAKDRFRAIDRATQQERIDSLERIAQARVKFMDGYRTDSQKLADDLKTYREKFAGTVSAEQQALDESMIRARYKKKEPTEKKPKDPLGEFITDQLNAQQRRDDEDHARRIERARDFGLQLNDQTEQLTAELITDERARADALTEIDRRRLQQQLDETGIAGERRLELLADIDRNIVARQALLTEQLKPEWERMLAAWADTVGSMKRFGDDFMYGFLRTGQQTWQDWAVSGKLSTRNLTDFIKSEFARLVYEQYLAQHTASLGKTLLSGVINGAIGLFGGSKVPVADGSGATGDFARFDRANTPMAIGTNYVPYDGFKAELHEGEAVVPKKYNPAAGGQAGGNITVNQTLNIGQGVSRAEVYAAARQSRAELMEELRRSRTREGLFA